MRLTWRRRAAVLVGLWLFVVGVMALLHMDPRPILLAAIAAALGATVCLMLDVSDIATPAAWQVGRGPAPLKRGSDFRIGLLQRQLVNAPDRHDSAAVHTLLIELIDDRLASQHGIDRADDAQRAAAVLGAQLVEFVERAPSPRQFSDPSYMSTILSRIEAL